MYLCVMLGEDEDKVMEAFMTFNIPQKEVEDIVEHLFFSYPFRSVINLPPVLVNQSSVPVLTKKELDAMVVSWIDLERQKIGLQQQIDELTKKQERIYLQ